MTSIFRGSSDETSENDRWTKNEYCVVIRYYFLCNLSAKQCVEEMTPILEEYCPSSKTIKRWYKQFKSDFSMENDPHSGPPAEAVTLKN